MFKDGLTQVPPYSLPADDLAVAKAIAAMMHTELLAGWQDEHFFASGDFKLLPVRVDFRMATDVIGVLGTAQECKDHFVVHVAQFSREVIDVLCPDRELQAIAFIPADCPQGGDQGHYMVAQLK